MANIEAIKRLLSKIKLEKEGGPLAVLIAELNTLLQDKVGSIRGLQGEKGEQGEPGHTPMKGIDYFDGEQGIQGLTGARGQVGPAGSKGDKGDYVQGPPGPSGLPGPSGSPDSPEDIRNKLQSLSGEARLDASAIKNLPELIRELPAIALFGTGGGGQVKNIIAGSNITIIKSDSGVYTISSTGGGSTPGGSDTQVQFNDGGSALGGSSGFTFNKNTLILSLGGDFYFSTDSVPTNRVIKVSDQTTVNTAGNALIISSGKGNGSGIGGTLELDGGEGGATGNGGGLQFIGGQGGATSGNGGPFNVIGGSAATSGTGGNTSIIGGDAAGTNKAGGNVILRAGVRTGSGTIGTVKIQDNSSFISAILLTTSLATSDKTFTFPNVTGTLLSANTTSAPSTTLTPTFTNYYGGNTNALGDPTAWITVMIGATTYKIPTY